MKKIPYGIIDFKTLIEEGYEYVDKTMYLEKLEDVAKTIFCLRPGRFGKSLFTSMMYYYYDVKSSGLFDTLFGDTYVGKSPTKDKNNYYVLKFDFSGITTAGKTQKDLEKGFMACITTGIDKFLNHYGFTYEYNENTSPDILIKKFLVYIDSLKLEHKVYILIDEYDNFTNAILEGDATKFLDVVGNTGFVKNFYAALKEYIGLGIVDRFFATGICPVTLDAMTTGFNIATDVSLNAEFNEMIGLTHAEVKKLLSEYSNDVKEEIYDIMIKNYDGYKFSKRSEIRIFNATLVMYLLYNYERYKRIPDELFDKNIVANYGKIDNLLKLQGNNIYQGIIDELLKFNKITGTLKISFNLLEEFERNDIISLLYYFGYLTIKEETYGNSIIFEIPNYIMKETYGNYFLKLLRDINIVIDTTKITNCIKEIVEDGSINNITEYISEILSLSDNRMFMKFDEKYIQVLYMGLLLGMKEFSIYSEYPCKNGYIDLMLLPRQEKMKYNIMIELKYIKKSEYSDGILDSKISEGEEQLRKYELDERIDKDNLKKYLVVFVGNDCKTLKEV